MNLRTKFIIYLLLLGVLPLLIFYVIAVNVQNSVLQTTLNEEIGKIESIMKNSFDSNLDNIKMVCKATSQSSVVKNALASNNVDGVKDYIKGMATALDVNGDYKFLIIGKNMKVFYDANDPSRNGESEEPSSEMEEAMSGKEVFGYMKTAEGYGSYAFYPIYSGSEVIGVTKIGTPLNSAYLSTVKKLTGENVRIYDNNTLVASSDPSKKLGENADNKIIQEVKRKGLYIKDDGNGVYSAYFALKEGNNFTGMAETTINLQHITNIGNRAHTIYLIILAITIITIIIIAFLIANSISKPILKISNNIDKMGEGDLTINFDIKSKDEIGKMSHSLTIMSKKLKDLMKLVADASLDISNKGEELASSMDSSNKNIQILMESSAKISGNAESASAATEEVTASGEEVASASQSVADSSQKLADKAENLSSIAKEGTILVKDMGKMIDDSVSEGNKTVEVVNLLNNDAKNVEEIISVIDGISEQTSLLALNAAIEAARAGEFGKGFAVIADEIRGLAEDSKKSTKKIAEILTKIQDGVVRTTEGTKSTIESIVILDKKMKEIYRMFNSIDEDVDEIMGMSSNMAAAAEQESASSEEIAKAMESASGAIVDITNQLSKMHEIIESQNEMNDEINKVSNDLSRLAEVVEEKVRAFKIM